MDLVGAFKGAADFASNEGSELATTWAHVLGSGWRGVRLRDFSWPRQSLLGHALRFLVYMTAATFIVSLPTASLAGVEYESELYGALSSGLEGLTWLAAGVCFHTVMRVAGGKGALPHGIETACLLSAFSPVLKLFLTPFEIRILPLTAKHENPFEVMQALYESSHHWSSWDWWTFWISSAASTVVVVVICVAFFRSFRSLHRLSVPRALVAFVAGSAALGVVAMFFLAPIDSRIL